MTTTEGIWITVYQTKRAKDGTTIETQPIKVQLGSTTAGDLLSELDRAHRHAAADIAARWVKA